MFGQLSFPSELAVLRFNVFLLMRRIDRKLSFARFLPLDHNIISRHKIWVLLHLQILVHTEIYIFLALKWRIKLMNQLRTEGENIIYVRSL